jgi:23S rRNA-/tRNA-specific pseudouridylate synthase
VPPLPKRKGVTGNNNNNGCFTLLSFLTDSHTHKRKHAFSRAGWRRRIERGQIAVDGKIERDPCWLLSRPKQTIEYHRRPWREPVVNVVLAGTDDGDDSNDSNGKYDCDDKNETLRILHIDHHLMVVHKPSRLPTMPSQTFFEYSVLTALRRLYEERTTEKAATGKQSSSHNHRKDSDGACFLTNVKATIRARQSIRSFCSAPPQPVHRLGVGTSGVLVVATSLLGRQKLTDALRRKSNNVNSNSNNSIHTTIRKVYRALVYAHRCDERITATDDDNNSNKEMRTYPCKRKGPLLPERFTVGCPIGLVPFPIAGESIHAACPTNSDFLYSHVHVHHTQSGGANDEEAYASGPNSPKSWPTGHKNPSAARTTTDKTTAKSALSHVRFLCWKALPAAVASVAGDTATNTAALVEVEIPTGRPHQIRIHMAYAGHPLVGDPLYLPGGIPDARPRTFAFRATAEEEDVETDDEEEEDRPKEPSAMTPLTRVALPRDCGYHLHAHDITLEHPSGGRSPCATAGVEEPKSDLASTATMTFTAPPPPILRDEP